MVEVVNRALRSEITSGKLQIDLGDVASLPYPDASMDRIYHCNCYYFWPEPTRVAGELYRVLKPRGFMVTAMCLDAIRLTARRGLLQGTSWEPEPYMETLRSAGFADVSIKNLVHGNAEKGTIYQAILAHKN